MCEATRQLQRLAFELRLQRGNGVIDLGKLERLTMLDVADEHQENT